MTPDCEIAFLLFCRYFLYSISKPNKEGSPTIDLSNDSDTNAGCRTSCSGAPYQVKLDRILTRAISAHSHFQPVISERLRSVLRAKLWRMGKQIHPLNSKRRGDLLDKWKKITWNIALKPAEVRSALIENQTKLQQDLTRASTGIRIGKQSSTTRRRKCDSSRKAIIHDLAINQWPREITETKSKKKLG